MAKQIKWMQVDADTQVSVAVSVPKSGSTNPNLSGLNQQFDWGMWNYGTCDDGVTIDNANYIFNISDADYIADITGKIDEYVKVWKEEIYTEEKQLRINQLGTYESTAYTAGAGYKYDAAVAFLSSATANAGLTTEATVRGISVTALANKIKTNHESFISKDAQISGLRGMLYDRILTIGINSTSVTTALASYAGIHTDETITNVGAGITYCKVGFYKPCDLSTRYEVLLGTYDMPIPFVEIGEG